MRRGGWAWVLGAALGGTVAPAVRAEVRLSVVPVLGSELVSNEGWVPLLARIESTEKTPLRARVVASGHSSTAMPQTEVALTLLPGSKVAVRLPMLMAHSWSTKVEVVGEDGKTLATEQVMSRGRSDAVLVDLHPLPRLSAALRGATVGVHYSPDRSRTAVGVAVSKVEVDATTGDPLLPQRGVEWWAATAVLAPSDVLARLGAVEQEALAAYVLAGGTLAVVVKRPEDLTVGMLPAMLGGPAREAGKARHLIDRSVPGEDIHLDGSSSSSTTRFVPGAAISPALVAYEGGNLKQSDLGMSAPYGLGEVHLYPFDPTSPEALTDPWALSRSVELVRHAWDRRPFVAMPFGGPSERYRDGALRRQLDPNESSRWAIIVATALLFLYAVGAGPVNFLLSARAGKPLRALWILPLLSGLVFSAIVALALGTKGWRGEARRVSLTEAAGGMSRGLIRRYRGFFTPVAQRVNVRPSSERALPQLVEETTSPLTIVVEREGVELRGVNVLPWQSTMVREEDIADLAGGVSLTAMPDGDVRVTNRLGRRLRGVLVQVPRRGLYHLSAVDDGAAVLASSGTALTTGAPPMARSSHGASGGLVHPLEHGSFRDALERDSQGLDAAWQAIDELSGDQTDWWPPEQPVLLAQIEGGEGVTEDQGLRLSRDRALLRVIGVGGRP